MSVKIYKYNDKTQLTKHFKVSEWKCKCGKKHDIKIDDKLPKLLEQVMEKIGAEHGNIYSGYRCSAHDKKVGGKGTGSHTLGYSVDIWFKDKNGKRIPSDKVVIALEDMKHQYGIGYRCGKSSVSSGNVHIDTRPRKWYGDEYYSNSQSISSHKAPSDGKTGHKTFLTYIYKPTIKYVNASVLNVRSDKNTTSKIVKGLKFGSEVKVYYVENDWAKIGVSEWVSAKYLQDIKPVKNVSSTDEVKTQKEDEVQTSTVTNENAPLNDETSKNKQIDVKEEKPEYEPKNEQKSTFVIFVEKLIDFIKGLLKDRV